MANRQTRELRLCYRCEVTMRERYRLDVDKGMGATRRCDNCNRLTYTRRFSVHPLPMKEVDID